MAHIALYRLWRPQAFRDVVGQQPIIRTLQNSLREGRLSHAYLFNGPRGTGKTTMAKILAKAVNCEHGPAEEPCNECGPCRRITEGSVMDVMEIDAASNRGVDEIRDLRDKVKYAPTEVRRKVYIIDEVHMLTTEAFNALLKTLEEPPEHVMFILATTEPHKLPPTIISRCQRFDFRRISLEEQIQRIRFVCEQEGVTYEPEAIQYIARLSEGGMRDALSLLDQIASFSGDHITYENVLAMTGGIASEQFARLAGAVRQRDIGAALGIVEALMQDGKSADKCMENLLHYFRDLLLIKMVPDSQTSTDRILDPEKFAETAAAFTREQIFDMIDTLNRYQTELKYSAQPQTLFEVAVMKLCTLDSSGAPSVPAAATAAAPSGEIAELKQKISRLEQQLERLMESGVPTAAGGASASAGGGRSSLRGSGASGGMKRPFKADGYLKGMENPLVQQIQSKWNQVLARVKETKITVHAWLIDGEPVSLQQDTVLLAFKSAMHRETTERPANKQLIEQVMSQVYGHSVQFATVMMKEWQEALQEGGAAGASAPAEEMKLVPEGTESGSRQDDPVEQAIQLFGEDLVEIKD